MTRFSISTKKALLLSVAVSTISVWFSLKTNNWNWFSRSGSLIVIIGIFLTSTQVIENSRKLNIRKRHHDNNFGRDYANDIKNHKLENSRFQDEDSWESSLRGLYLLIVGTIIWGYGDLLGLLFIH